jgi:glutamyl endopeptidase
VGEIPTRRAGSRTGNTVGRLGYRWQGTTLTGTSVTVRGCPGDKASGTLWTHSGSIRYSYTSMVG